MMFGVLQSLKNSEQSTRNLQKQAESFRIRDGGYWELNMLKDVIGDLQGPGNFEEGRRIVEECPGMFEEDSRMDQEDAVKVEKSVHPPFTMRITRRMTGRPSH